jgi:acetyl esterase/lipase
VAAEPVVLRDVGYATPAKTSLKLDFVRPAGDGPFPLVACVHGGGWRTGSRDEYKDFQTHMAGLGYATASVQYRFAPAHRFPAPVDDVTAALKFLADGRAKYRIDPDRVGLMGGSAGGHLALMVGFGDGSGCRIRAIVNVCGPTDLRTFASTAAGDKVLKAGVGRTSGELLEDLLGTADRKAEVYATASPITRLRKDGPAVLTLHGDADDLVPLTQAEALHAELKKLDATHRLIVAKGGGHDVAKWPDKERAAALLAALAHFKEHLKP